MSDMDAMAPVADVDTTMATEEVAEPTGPLPWGGFIALVWSLATVFLLAITAFAFYMGYRLRHKNRTQEEFITARGQVSMLRTAWTFFAGACGAWVIAGPAQYASFAGMIGLVFYALASGLPVIMTAYAGGMIQAKYPNVLSLTDFMGWRYGWVAKTYVLFLCCFNMSIAMLAEYATIGSLFKSYLGSVDYPIILLVGICTLAYTAYGGLLVSILTDQIQGISSALLTIVAGIYLAAEFREPLVKPMPSSVAGTNEYGYSAIFVMPVSLFTATVFSEAMWQRAWAADSNRNLRRGSMLGAGAIIFVVFVFGLMGWLAAWSWLATGFYPADANLTIFYALEGSLNPVTSTVNNWIGVVVILLAVLMNAGAVDSLQNGLGAAISSHLLKGYDLMVTRGVVVVINAILMAIPIGYAAEGEPLEVLSLFLITNMLCSTSAIPVLAGLIDCIEPYYGGVSMVLSCLISIFCTSAYGVNECWGKKLEFNPDYFIYECIPTEDGDSSSYFSDGMAYTWYRNGYLWQYFLVASATSLGATLMMIGINWGLQKAGLEQKKEPFGFKPESKKHLDVSVAAATDKLTESEGSEDGGLQKPLPVA